MALFGNVQLRHEVDPLCCCSVLQLQGEVPLCLRTARREPAWRFAGEPISSQ